MPHMEAFSSFITFDETCTRELCSTQLQPPSPLPLHFFEPVDAKDAVPRPRELTFVPFDPSATEHEENIPWPITPYTYDLVHRPACSTVWSSHTVTDELQLLRWLEANTTVPVPRLEAEGYDMTKQQYYAVFASPGGVPLSEGWEELTDDAQSRATEHLQSIMKQLRSIHTTKLPNHGTKDAFLDRRDGVTPGPFQTQQDYLAAVANRIDAIGAIYNPGPTKRAIGFLEALDCMTMDKSLVFTHGNLNPENIWVDERGQITAIMNWSQAGYAPVFWEYIKASLSDDESEVQFDGLYDEIMQPWPLHLAVMMHVRDIIW